MAIRIAPLDDNLDFPEPVRRRQAERLADATTVEGKVLAASFNRTTMVRDIRDFLLPGEILDTTNKTNMTPLFQRAVDALGVEYAAQTGSFGVLGLQIYVPNGLYRFDTQLNWKPGVGIVGESNFGTIFFPRTNHSFIDGSGKGASYPFTDCNFTRFAVDGKFQNVDGYTTNVKGIFIQHMKRSTYESVIVRNTWATGFGVDHLEDTVFINCVADGNGRGLAVHKSDPHTSSGHSGFGIGSGGSQLEAVSIINCIAKNNGLYGIFTEKQKNQDLFPDGLRVIGCVSTGNWVGFKDCGSTGAIVQGNQFMHNTLAGVALDGTHLVPTAGKDGLITNNVIAYNAIGLLIGSASLGGYRISGNEIYKNVSHGIHAPTTASIGKRYIFRGNNVHENGGDGMRVETSSDMMTIDTNQFWGNRGTDFALLGADKAANGLSLSGNDFRGASLVVQQRLDGAIVASNPGLGAPPRVTLVPSDGVLTASWDAPLVVGADSYTASYRRTGAADWVNIPVPAAAQSVTITGLLTGRRYEVRVAGVKDGATSTYTTADAVVGNALITDDFNRADTTAGLGSTTTGTAWSVTEWFISNGKAKAPLAPAYAQLNVGSVDRTVTATFTKVPADSLGLVARMADPNNWIGLVRSSSGFWVIQKRVKSTYTVLLETGIPVASGDTVTIRTKGATFDATVNKSPTFTVVDESLPTPGFIALRGASGAEVDNLIVSQSGN